MTYETSTVCAYCGMHHDMATAMDGSDATLHPGDLTMCFTCGALNVMGNDGKLRRETEAERQEHAKDWRIDRMQLTWRMTRGDTMQ